MIFRHGQKLQFQWAVVPFNECGLTRKNCPLESKAEPEILKCLQDEIDIFFRLKLRVTAMNSRKEAIRNSHFNTADEQDRVTVTVTQKSKLS